MARPRKDMTDQTEVTKEKAATKPGWRPASKNPELRAPSGYTARWVSKEPGEIARKRAEGWEVMRPEDNKAPEIVQHDVNDGKAVHNGIVFRDLIAMMLPNELKKEREEYYRKENLEAKKAILDKTDRDAKKMGIQTYAPNKGGRIVIN